MARKSFVSQGSSQSIHSKPRRLSAHEDDYDSLQVIGHGTFGLSMLWAAKYQDNEGLVMLRKIDLDMLSTEDLENLEFEVWLSSQLRHSGVLLYHSSFVSKSTLITVYPLYDYGSCHDILQAGFPGGMPELAIAFILHEMLNGLDYLHKMHYIHRAVKASHILVSSDGRVCLSGLRYSTKTEYDDNRGLIAHSFPSHTIAMLPWIAPEVLEQNLLGYGTKSDIYSVGITALELYTASIPFNGLQPTQILLHKLNGTVPDFKDTYNINSSDDLTVSNVPSGFSAEGLQMLAPSGKQQHLSRSKQSSSFRQFVDISLRHSPNERPRADSLQSHSFFKQLKKKGKDVTITDLLQPLKPISDTPTLQCDNQSPSPDIIPSPDLLSEDIQHLSLNDQWIL